MRARAWWGVVLVAWSFAAHAEPKPAAVDIKPFRDQLLVLQDATGATYVVLPGNDSRAWYGTGKTLYEQVVVARSADGSAGTWSVDVLAPHVSRVRPGSILRRDNGTFEKYCGDEKTAGLTQLTGDKAKAVLDKSAFMTTALVRRPHLLARDDAGVYYYVDAIREQYGGKGFRVFVGKKGAMKQLPLTDIASDSAGEVFSTRTGDIRIVHDNDDESNQHGSTTWVKGEKKTTLLQLDVDRNSPLIYKDLGVYSFTGTLCDER